MNSIYFINEKKNKYGTWKPEKLLKDKKVLIVGPGKNLSKDLKKIHKKIIEKKLFVISLNTLKTVDEKFIKLRVLCHPLRLISDKKNFKNLKSPLVIPYSSLSKTIKASLRKYLTNFLDFGLRLKENKDPKIFFGSCTLPYPLAIAYAISIAISGKASKILFAGFDGYEKSDPEHDQTEEILELLKKNYFKKQMISLTKTKYFALKYKLQ